MPGDPVRTVFLVVGLLLMTARPGGADIGILVMEPVQALGFFTRVGDRKSTRLNSSH